MTHEDDRMQILEMIESGKISTDEGLQLLQSMLQDEQTSHLPSPDQTQDIPSPSEASQGNHNGVEDVWIDGEPASQNGQAVTGEVYAHPAWSESSELPPDVEKWRRWWIVLLWIGVGITVIGGSLMYASLQASGIGFWFLCAGLVFTLGLLTIILAWQARSAPWLHIRIQQRPGHSPERIALSFPLPIRMTAWFFRTFRYRIPGLENTSIDEVILALENSATSENPLYISVNDEEDGENIQIFIG